MNWLQITANHFCACVDIQNGLVKEAAPILRYMRGWSQIKVINYCHTKGWKLES